MTSLVRLIALDGEIEGDEVHLSGSLMPALPPKGGERQGELTR